MKVTVLKTKRYFLHNKVSCIISGKNFFSQFRHVKPALWLSHQPTLLFSCSVLGYTTTPHSSMPVNHCQAELTSYSNRLLPTTKRLQPIETQSALPPISFSRIDSLPQSFRWRLYSGLLLIIQRQLNRMQNHFSSNDRGHAQTTLELALKMADRTDFTFVQGDGATYVCRGGANSELSRSFTYDYILRSVLADTLDFDTINIVQHIYFGSWQCTNRCCWRCNDLVFSMNTNYESVYGRGGDLKEDWLAHNGAWRVNAVVVRTYRTSRRYHSAESSSI